MVKADAKRDYYADLELPPTAEHEDIKKQFRLLGTFLRSLRPPYRSVANDLSQTLPPRQESRT